MKLERDYRTLTDLVLRYKNATASGNKRLQNNLMKQILQRLCHIINQLVSIITDTPFTGKQQVYKIMIEKMRILTNQNNQDKIRFTCSRIVESQKLSQEDVRQQIILYLLELIDSYTPKGEFIQYVTYLLPRRITQWLWKQAKSVSQQFNTISTDQDEEEETKSQSYEIDQHLLNELVQINHAAYTADAEVYNKILRAVLEVDKQCDKD